MIIAVKPRYNFKTKTYCIEPVLNGNPLLAHEGYLVFNDPPKTLVSIRNGGLLSHWKEAKRVATIEWLEQHIKDLQGTTE